MRKLGHLLFGEAGESPALDPGPGSDVGNGVLALAVAGQVLARLAGVLAAQADLQHAVDAQRLVHEPRDRVRDLLLRELVEVVRLPLVRRAGPVPEEQPLDRFALFELVGEAARPRLEWLDQRKGAAGLQEGVVLVVLVHKVEKLGRCFHDRERRRDGVVNDDRNTAIGIEAEKPVLLLLIGRDIDQSGVPGVAVDESKLFKQNLNFLTIWCRLRH